MEYWLILIQKYIFSSERNPSAQRPSLLLMFPTRLYMREILTTDGWDNFPQPRRLKVDYDLRDALLFD